MQLGVIIGLTDNPAAEFEKIQDMGLSTCQLAGWNETLFTPEAAQRVKQASADMGIEITALWCGWGGPAIWNLVDGPNTLGLVPPTYRFERMQTLLKGAEFAQAIGVQDVVTHVGFIPENPNDPEYSGLVSALRYLVSQFSRRGCNFLFETGQETPVVLLRTIEDIGLLNIGINLDPANLILYGKGNPVDSLDVFGGYVRGVHAKDGCYPTSGRYLGEEMPIGQGKVDFPRLLAGLKKLGYTGALTIEREISGEQQVKDIHMAIGYINKILQDLA
jgi:sugar phosphate isomerase/epimerase